MELAETYSGIRTGSETTEQVLEILRRKHFDHSLIYIELLEVIEKDDEIDLSISSESMIILPWLLVEIDAYDTFLP